ncbi:MAG: hypothetical protein JWO71_4440 [Candidatus Acidoferrum typicum]|nr:hypothetical protein [Candidatus Acidoferrum typicum]
MIEENSTTNQPKPDDEDSSKKGTQPVDPQSSIPPTGSHQSLATEPAHKKTADQAEGPHKKIEKHTLIVAWAGLIVACITGVIFYRQFSEMQTQTGILSKQAEDAGNDATTARRNARQEIRTLQAQVAAIERQMRQDQRAWIKIELGPLVTNHNPTAGTVIPFVPVTISNTGKSPAKNISGKFVMEKVPNGQSPSLRYDVQGRRVTVGSMWQGTSLPRVEASIFRINPTSKQYEVRPLSTAENEEILKGKAYLATYARVEYDDVFGIHHWTTACAFSTEDTPGVYKAEACTSYNGVDDN